MSTKIHNGYKMKSLNVLELNEFYKELRSKLTEVYTEKYLNLYMALCVNMINKMYLLNDEYKKSKDKENIDNFLSDIHHQSNNKFGYTVQKLYNNKKTSTDMQQIIKDLSYKIISSVSMITRNYIEAQCSLIELTKESNYSFDFLCDLCMLPLNTEETLFLAYGSEFEDLLYNLIKSRKKKDKEFVGKYKLETYGYWNTIDKPKNISKKNWQKRCSDWEIVLPDYVAPVEMGMSVDIMNINVFFENISYDILTKKNFLNKRLISFEDNCLSVALNMIKNDYILNYYEEHKSKENDKIEYHLFGEGSKEFKEKYDKKDEKIMLLLNDKIEYLKTILKPITRETLFNPITSFLPDYMNDIDSEKE